MLTYVCAKYFEGAAEQIKEYNIAVDALGRPAQFDQKRDSIVRVEAHRLRKRLREYYEADGADHVIRIDIPPGQYAPRFLPSGSPLASLSAETLVAQGELASESAAPAPAPDPAESEPPAMTLVPIPATLAIPADLANPVGAFGGASSKRIGAVVTVLVLIGGAAAVELWRPARKAGAIDAGAPPGVAAVASPPEVRILAGHQNGDYADRLGRIWQTDRYFQGGSVFESHDHPIFGTREPRIYQSRREGSFAYDIPLPAGVYELRLHFAETLYGENNVAGGGENSRAGRNG